jgi:uncharacterized protein DUF3375
MKAETHVATYRTLREQPLWKLLASDNASTVLAILQTNLYDKERTLSASVFLERVARDLEELRAVGEDLPQAAQAYVSQWLSAGYLVRRFPAGASEEEYELSVSGVEALRFVSNMERPHSAATESRLAVVIGALLRLAEDTDADKGRRTERLNAERARIDQQIDGIRHGELRVLPTASALERTREIISLADTLAADFRRVRDEFERLNRELRQQVLDEAESRGAVLKSLFSGIDVIAESEAGRTFAAFWRLLTDPEQTAALDQALEDVVSREFVSRLDGAERRFLLRMPGMLLAQGGAVHDVFQHLARSLKQFVASREYLEQRRLNEVVKEAQRAALEIKDTVPTTQLLSYWLELTSSRVGSISQWFLYDPAMQAAPGAMADGESPAIDLGSIGDLVARSEIDFRSLKENVCVLLEEAAHASIGDVLTRFPAKQGLGTVVGLLALGSRHGLMAQETETVAWTGEDHVHRRARIPKIFFVRERVHELA